MFYPMLWNFTGNCVDFIVSLNLLIFGVGVGRGDWEIRRRVDEFSCDWIVW
jgi:hypothetical protein